MLIENDLLNSKIFIIDVEKKTVLIENCKIDISLQIQFKSFYIKKTIHAQQTIILQSDEK